MSRRKKSGNRVQAALAAIARANAAPVIQSPEIPRAESRREFAAREQREEQEQRMAPIRKLQAENEKILLEIEETRARTIFDYWSQPLKVIAQRGIGSGFVNLNLPTTASPNKGLTDQTFGQCISDLEKEGYSFSRDSRIRFGCFAEVQAANGVVINMESLRTIFEALLRADAFGDAVTKPVEQTAPAPEAVRPTLANLSDATTLTDDGRAKHKVAVEHDHANQIKPLFDEWASSLYSNFNYVLTDSMRKECWNWIQRNNQNPLDRRTYDKLRVAFVDAYKFPESFLTPEEVLCRDIECADINSRETRSAIARRQYEMRRLQTA